MLQELLIALDRGAWALGIVCAKAGRCCLQPK